MNDEEAQQLYGAFVELQQQAQTLNEHLEQMQEQRANIEQTRKTITELQTIKEPTQGWIPIAPGAYVKETTEPVKTVLLNIGAGVAVEKEPADVLATLEEHAKVIDELTDAAVAELKETIAKIDEIKTRVDAVQAAKTTERGNQ